MLSKLKISSKLREKFDHEVLASPWSYIYILFYHLAMFKNAVSRISFEVCRGSHISNTFNI